MMASLLVNGSAPPNPSICRLSGEPNTARMVRLRASSSTARSLSLRNPALLVPPRMITHLSWSAIFENTPKNASVSRLNVKCQQSSSRLQPLPALRPLPRRSALQDCRRWRLLALRRFYRFACGVALHGEQGMTQMAAHGLLGRIRIARLHRGDHLAVLLEHFMRPALSRRGSIAVDAKQIVEVIAQKLDQLFVAAALDDAKVEIIVARTLVVAIPGFQRAGLGMAFQQALQFVQFGEAHALRSEPARHAFQCLPDVQEISQI